MCDAASTELMNHPVRRLPLITRPKVPERMGIPARRLPLVTRPKLPVRMKNPEAKPRQHPIKLAPTVLKPVIVNLR